MTAGSECSYKWFSTHLFLLFALSATSRPSFSFCVQSKEASNYNKSLHKEKCIKENAIYHFQLILQLSSWLETKLKTLKLCDKCPGKWLLIILIITLTAFHCSDRFKLLMDHMPPPVDPTFINTAEMEGTHNAAKQKPHVKRADMLFFIGFKRHNAL